jgi:hypothetical protein
MRPLPPNTVRLAAAALLVVGGALGALVPFVHPGHGPGYYAHPGTATAHLLLFAAVLALSLGLPALVRDGAGGRPAATIGAALYFVGVWCLDGTHGIVDGAVLPTLAAVQPKAAPLLAPGVASQAMLAAGPMGLIVDAGIAAFTAGSLLLGLSLARAGRLPRAVGWAIAAAWPFVPLSELVPSVRLAALALPYVALVAAGLALALVDVRARRRVPATAPVPA